MTLADRTDVTRAWSETNSWDTPEWTIAELEAAKAGRTVSVVLPALNEEQTVAAVIDTIHPLLGGLVDELIDRVGLRFHRRDGRARDSGRRTRHQPRRSGTRRGPGTGQGRGAVAIGRRVDR